MTDVQGESILRGHEERCRELIAGLTVMDDILMRNVLNQTECTEYVLQTIMGQKELKVLECVVQKDYKNLQGRSAILDCVARYSGSVVKTKI